MGARTWRRVQAATIPYTRGEPFLEVPEPDKRPGHDRLGDPLRRRPLAGAGQVQAELGRALLIDVGEFSAIGQRAEIRVEDVDLRELALLIFDQDRISAAQRI